MKISLLGIGLMGQAIAEHLLAKGHQVTVYNRSADKTNNLQQLGAKVAENAEQAIRDSDFTLLLLSDENAIFLVLDTVAIDAFNGKTIVQMGTIAPDESRTLAKQIQLQQGKYLECPVLGSLPEARSGTLILMAGGSEEDYRLALPLLNELGKKPQLIGDIGHGATVKLAMNQLIAGLTASFSLSLALVEKEGIEITQFMDIVRDSALYAPTFDKKLERMLSRDFDNPNFPTKHLAKDTQLFLEVAKQHNLETCALQGVATLLDKTLNKGLANTDYSAIFAGITNQTGSDEQ